MAEHREVLAYLFFGGLTTLVNIASYWVFARLYPFSGTAPATLTAWLLSVLFAYATNRRWVFQSRASEAGPILREILSFFGARAFSGLLDLGVMFLFVDCLRFWDMPVKILSNVLVVVINYLLSKFWIFRKNR